MRLDKKKEISYLEFEKVSNILESSGNDADKTKEIFSLLFGLNKAFLDTMSVKQFYKYDKKAKELLNVPVSLKKFFVIDGVKYYLIPCFDSLKTNELIDLDNHFNNGDYVSLFNILYRPLKGKVKGYRYNIEPYNDVRYFDDLPYHVVIGALDFFRKSYSLLNPDLATYSEANK